MIYDKNTSTTITNSLTNEQKAEAHVLISQGKSLVEIHKEKGLPFEPRLVRPIINELKIIEKEIIEKVKEVYVVSEAIPAKEEIKDEEGNIIQEAVEAQDRVLYEYTTKDALLDSIDTFYDKELLLEDVVKYNPTYNPDRTFVQFKSIIKEV